LEPKGLSSLPRKTGETALDAKKGQDDEKHREKQQGKGGKLEKASTWTTTALVGGKRKALVLWARSLSSPKNVKKKPSNVPALAPDGEKKKRRRECDSLAKKKGKKDATGM